MTRAAEALAGRGVHVAWIDPEPSGRVAPEAIAAAVDRAAAVAPVRLVSLQAVNHETGVVQPIAEAAAIVHARGARLHVDAVQAVGRLHAGGVGRGRISRRSRPTRSAGRRGSAPSPSGRASGSGPSCSEAPRSAGCGPGRRTRLAAAGFAAAARRAIGGPARSAALAPLRDRLEAELVEIGRAAGAAPIRNGDGDRAPPHHEPSPGPAGAATKLCAALDLERRRVQADRPRSAGTAEAFPGPHGDARARRAASAVRFSIGEDTAGGRPRRATRRVAPRALPPGDRF